MAVNDLSGRTLSGRYRLVQPLARGGMASVWVAEDTLLGRKVAVKTLHPELATDADLRTRFRQEAISAASLAHPAIVTTYDTGEDDGVAYIVMELVEGPNLRRVLDREGTLSIAETLRIGRWVVAALEHSHRNGIVHRDIKPANVLVPAEGPAKVTDFGIAKAEGGSDLTRVGTVVGTARYLSPEQVRGDPVDARADVYAVGLVLYEMLAGRLPFRGETDMATALARLTTSPQPLYEIRPDVPHSLDRVVAHCLTVDPAERFASGAALAVALTDVFHGDTPAPPTQGPVAPGPSPLTPSSRPMSSHSISPHPMSGDATVAPRRGPVTAVHETVPPTRGRRPARPRRAVRAAVAIVVLAGVIGAGYLALRDGGEGGGGGPPEIVSVTDFDPEGDGQENPSQVANVTDGDAATTWATERYNTPDLGGLKSGVGLRFDLAASAEIHSVAIEAAEGDWAAEIYVAEEAADSLAGWGTPVSSFDDAAANKTISVDPAATGRAVLVWFTRVPSGGRLTIAEIRIR